MSSKVRKVVEVTVALRHTDKRVQQWSEESAKVRAAAKQFWLTNKVQITTIQVEANMANE